MYTLMEYVLQGVALVVVVFLSLCTLLLTRVGRVALFVVTFAAAIAVPSGLALLATDFLYPGTGVVAGFGRLLWLVIPASVASVILFDLVLEGFVLRFLRRMGMALIRIRLLEAFLGGLFTALSLFVAAQLLPETKLYGGAALVAGQTGAFARYYLGLWLGETNFGGDEAILDDMDFEELDQPPSRPQESNI